MGPSTETMWRERVASWRASGLTAAEFARRGGYAASTILYWQRRLAAKAKSPATVALARVAPSEAAAAPGGDASVDVLITPGIVVRVGPAFSATLLQAVLRAVRELG